LCAAQRLKAMPLILAFLVPTPEKPELAELPNEVFNVGHLMAPETVYRDEKGIRLVIGLASFFTMGRVTSTPPADMGVPRSVRVIEETRVAGYDAVILEADDSDALSAWLKEHDYPSSPELQEWFEPYVAMKWKITAFKISGNQADGNISTSAVRMSFRTERPFFPYREPKMDTAGQSRVLQILMLSPQKMEGKLGEGMQGEWPGETLWANRLKSGEAESLLDQMKISIDPKALWLIHFEDSSSPRPGHSDLFFQPATSQTPVLPPPVIITRDARIPIPVDLLLVIALVSILIYKRRQTRAQQA
jgi:hypothetical protein